MSEKYRDSEKLYGIVLTIDWYLEHEEWMEHITSGNYQKYYEEMYKNK